MHQVKQLAQIGDGHTYRLKVARKWAMVFEWNKQDVTLKGFRYRGDKNCYAE